MEDRMQVRWPVLVIGAIALLAFAIWSCQEGPFGRRQFVSLSPKQEAALGAQAFQEVLQTAKVIPSGPTVEAVSRVSRRLAEASSDPLFLKRTGLKPMKFDWEFRVVDSKEVNAFCLPGGKIVVYTGILPVCETEAGLATVLGHEIGHALAHHGAERIAQQQMVQIAQIATAVSLSDVDDDKRMMILAALGVGAQVGLLHYSREHESEADHIGLLLMSQAGYDPKEAVTFWERMAKQSHGHGPSFLSTHPSHETRIRDLRAWQDEAQELYARSQKQKPANLPGHFSDRH
jgi:predicted Zn-dependent protease